TNQDVVRKLSSILRVADALDFRSEQRVESVSCALNKNLKALTISAASTANLHEEIEWAIKKGKLIQEVFNLKLSLKQTRTSRPK
ncbi:MAG TPA: hypothetical protein VNT76_09570, partial [Candidatus Binatus sp.]|nr:hypothetical protein [Candidatus Binatus sp.]